MVALEFLDGFVEVDYAVEEGEYVGGEVGYVLHGPVVGVEDGEEVVHPGGVDEGPGHQGEEVDLSLSSVRLLRIAKNATHVE